MRTGVETLFLIYDESLETEISAIVQRDMVVSRYTRIDGVVGARMAEQEDETGYIGERRNRLILLMADPSTIAHVVDDLKALRARKGHGLRAFVVKASTVI